jgi:hypothetical protein
MTDLPEQPSELHYISPTPSGHVPVLAWVHESWLPEVHEAHAQFATPKPGHVRWSKPLLQSLRQELTLDGQQVLQALSNPSHRGRWVRSVQIAEELDITPKKVGVAVAMIRAEATTLGLTPPIERAVKRRKPDGTLARYLRLRDEVVDLLQEETSLLRGPRQRGSR